MPGLTPLQENCHERLALDNCPPSVKRMAAIILQDDGSEQLPQGQGEPFDNMHEHISLLASQFNTNIFVSAVMLSSYVSMPSTSIIAHNPLLRTLGTVAWVLDAFALACATVLRLRLLYLQQCGNTDLFIEDYWSVPRRDGSIYLNAPIILICSAMGLFMIELMGYVFPFSFLGDVNVMDWTTYELAFIYTVVGFCLAYFVGVSWTVLALGRRTSYALPLSVQQSASDKV